MKPFLFRKCYIAPYVSTCRSLVIIVCLRRLIKLYRVRYYLFLEQAIGILQTLYPGSSDLCHVFLREKDDFVFIASLYFEWYSVEESFDLFLYSAGRDLSLLYPSLVFLSVSRISVENIARRGNKT